VGSFFAGDYQGTPFRQFDLTHLAALGAITLACVAVGFWWHNPSPRARRAFRYTLASLLLVVNLSCEVWNWSIGVWSIQTDLPLHLCTAMLYANAVLLLTKSYRLYEFGYFLGIGGAVHALLTPDIAPYGFPHYRYFHYFIGHGASIVAALYMTVVEGYRPSWRSFLHVVVGANLYTAALFLLNLWLGSNYMFLMQRPGAPTVLDRLGPWPWYVLAAEPIALVTFLLLYLPFAIRDRRAARRLSVSAGGSRGV